VRQEKKKKKKCEAEKKCEADNDARLTPPNHTILKIQKP
jgi:hypothetical protein